MSHNSGSSHHTHDGDSREDDSPRKASSEGSSEQTVWGSVLRFLIPAVILVVGVYFGLKAFQENSEEESEQSKTSQAAPPSNVIVTPLRLVSARDTHRVIGSLRAANRAEVAAREEGAILEILVNEGDTVAQNDILVRLDARRLDAQIARAQANLTAARATIAQREAEEARFATDFDVKKKLFDQNAISESELLDAETGAAVSASQGRSARESLLAAEAEIRLLELRREDLVIRAPFDARVTARTTEMGEWVRAGDPLLTIISEGRIEAWLQVPERFVGDMTSDTVMLKIGNQDIEGTNLRIVPEADTMNRGITVIADIADPENRLVPGLSVAAELPVTDDIPRLMVPSDAVVTTYAGEAVFRANAAASPSELPIAERLPVQVLFQQGGQIFIASEELREGDLIVVKGNERLFPGTQLLIEEADDGNQQPPDPQAIAGDSAAETEVKL